jgi:hypothetical protein
MLSLVCDLELVGDWDAAYICGHAVRVLGEDVDCGRCLTVLRFCIFIVLLHGLSYVAVVSTPKSYPRLFFFL